MSFFSVALVLSAAAVGHFTGPAVIFHELVIASQSGSPLRVVYVFPPGVEKFPERSCPAVVAIPPYSVPPEAMEIICVELARRGAVCAIPDFFGKTREESRQRMGKDSLSVLTLDVASIVATLRALPFVDPERIGLNGHSVGGTVAVLAGMRDPRIRSVVPIGMVSMFYEKSPKNLLFLSGLYDEIHSPASLLENLRENDITEEPENNKLYGDPEKQLARQVTIIPTTDHFIETFDPLLIRALLSWYAMTLEQPSLGQGPLREWWRKVSAFFLMISAAVLYAIVMAGVAKKIANRFCAHQPNWLTLRIQALPALFILFAIWIGGNASPDYRLVAADLMIGLLLAQEVVSHRARGVLRYGDRSPYRNFRGVVLVLLALGAATLLTYGLMSVPYYFRFPDMLLWYPAFVFNMIVLFPLEVFGRIRPLFFGELINGFEPGNLLYILTGLVFVFPGLVIRCLDRFAEEIIVTFRARMAPIVSTWPAGPETKTEQSPAQLQSGVDMINESPGPGPSAATSLLAAITPLKAVVLIVLLGVLGFLVYRRITEGMLTLETARLAGITLLRFAVLPFIITAFIVRTRFFRRISYLD